MHNSISIQTHFVRSSMRFESRFQGGQQLQSLGFSCYGYKRVSKMRKIDKCISHKSSADLMAF